MHCLRLLRMTLYYPENYQKTQKPITKTFPAFHVFDENVKNAINVEFSKRSIDNKSSFEWIFFNDSLFWLEVYTRFIFG